MPISNEQPKRLTDCVVTSWSHFWFSTTDAYTLCVMRVLVGLVAIYTLATLTPDLERFFSKDGILTVEVVDQLRDDQIRDDQLRDDDSQSGGLVARGYLEWFDTRGQLMAVHAIGMAVVLAFTLGLGTRVTSVAALIVILSYVHRAPMLTGPMEQILCLWMFCLCFAPCGAFLSIDRMLAVRRIAENPAGIEKRDAPFRHSLTANVAIRLIQVHLVLFCLTMALAKLNDGVILTNEDGEQEVYKVWWSGEAVWWLAAKVDAPLIDFAPRLADHLFAVNFWTHAIVIFELSFGVLIWIRVSRRLLLGISLIMWTSLALLSGMLTFYTLLAIGNLAFIDPDAVRRIVAWLTRQEKPVPVSG